MTAVALKKVSTLMQGLQQMKTTDAAARPLAGGIVPLGNQQGGTIVAFHQPGGHNPHHPLMPVRGRKHNTVPVLKAALCLNLRYGFVKDPAFHLTTLKIGSIQLCRQCCGLLRIFSQQQFDTGHGTLKTSNSIQPGGQLKPDLATTDLALDTSHLFQGSQSDPAAITHPL